MFDLTTIFHGLQRQLFPALEEERGPLTALDQQFCEVISLTDWGRFTQAYEWCGEGRPPCRRLWLAHAFIAKSVYQFPTTGALIEALKARPTLRRLCGGESPDDVPSEATFSRAFTEFAADQLPPRIHENMIQLHAGPKLVGHVSRDATAIEAPERPAPKPPAPPKVPGKRGRPKQGEERPAPPPKRREVPRTRPLVENLAALPARCDVGCKRNSQGHQESWIGDKLHLDTGDGDLPVSAVLTSASVPDSQGAIPLAQMTAARLTSLYDLMDSAYDAPQIRAFSEQLGHVPIIDPNPRGGEKIPLAPAQAQRFKQRSASERVNRLLKERDGGRWVRVRGAAKVMCHLMFGLVAWTATALFARLCGSRLTAPPVTGGPDAAPETRRERWSVAADDEKLRIHGCCAGLHVFRRSPPVSPLSRIGVLKAPRRTPSSAVRPGTFNLLSAVEGGARAGLRGEFVAVKPAA
jgi:hypothetical protein